MSVGAQRLPPPVRGLPERAHSVSIGPFIDRMLWLYEDMKGTSPEYRAWLYQRRLAVPGAAPGLPVSVVADTTVLPSVSGSAAPCTR